MMLTQMIQLCSSLCTPQKTGWSSYSGLREEEKKKRTVKLDKTFTGFMIHTDKNSSGNLRNSSKVLV